MTQFLQSCIVKVYKSSESLFVKALSHYPHKDAFFEMVRFDFVIDEDLKVNRKYFVADGGLEKIHQYYVCTVQ